MLWWVFVVLRSDRTGLGWIGKNQLSWSEVGFGGKLYRWKGWRLLLDASNVYSLEGEASD